MFTVDGVGRRVGDRVLYSDICFRLDAGQRAVLWGPSGSGKTLLLRSLAQIDALESGNLCLQNRSPGEWGQTNWRARVAWLPQEPTAFSGTPAEWAARLRSLTAQHERQWQPGAPIAEALGIDWTQPWAQLSGGERQRAHLALLLASNPDVLLLDEPTSALDDAATARVEALLEGCTCVWVTHDKAQARRVADFTVEIGT